MKINEIMELFDYNLWANNRLFEAAAQLPTDQYLKDVKASHAGIHGTLAHIVGAQKLWVSRWLSSPDKTLMRGADVSTLLELISIWEKVSSDTAKFLAGLNDEKLQETLLVTTTSGQQYTHTFQQMLQHLVSHSTGHRGQVVAMMRQCGITPPNIDLISYYRQRRNP